MSDLKDKLATKVEPAVITKSKTIKVFKSFQGGCYMLKGESLRPDLNGIFTPKTKEQEEFFRAKVKAGSFYEVEVEQE